MDIQCPNCGSFHTVLGEGHISWLQVILSIISVGFYDPSKKALSDSEKSFKAGIGEATCLACGYRFRAFEKIDPMRIEQNVSIRLEGETRLALEEKREQEILKNYPHS